MDIEIYKKYLEKMKSIGITKWLLLGLAGLLLVGSSYIGKPTDKKVNNKESNNANKEYAYSDYKYNVQSELEELIGNIKGIENVKVMITFKSTEEKIVKEDSEIISENDDGGESGNKSSKQSKKINTVIVENAGEEQPYIVKENYPSVEGVAVCAKGITDAETKNNIINIVQALFDVEAHKISVTEMK